MRCLLLKVSALLMLLCTQGCSESPVVSPVVNHKPQTADDPLADDPVIVKQVSHAKLSAEWPQWGGPQGSGQVSVNTDDVDWEAEPKVLWRQQIGVGYSNVAVVDGIVYAYGHTDGQETLYAFELATGDVLWSQSVVSRIMDNLHKGGPGGTPLVINQTIVTLSKQGDLHARSVTDGQLIWTLSLPERYGVETPEWGFTAAPIMLNQQTLVVECGVLTALNLKTGETLWQTETHHAGYGSPVVIEKENQTYVATLTNDELLVVDAQQGQTVSSFDWTTKFRTSATTPVYHNDQFFVSTGYNRGCALLNWNEGELEQVYELKTLRAHMSTPVAIGNSIYGIDGNSHSRRTCQVVCIDQATGETQWEERGLGCASLIAVNSMLVIFSDEGELVIGHADPEKFERSNSFKVLDDDKCWTAPVYYQGRVLCRGSAGELVCVDFRRRI